MSDVASGRDHTLQPPASAPLLRGWVLRSAVVLALGLELALYIQQTTPVVVAVAALGMASLLLVRRWPYVPLALNLVVAALGGPIPIALSVAYFVIMRSTRLGWRTLLPTVLCLIGNSGLLRDPLENSIPYALFFGAIPTSIAAAFGVLVYMRRELASTYVELQASHQRERASSAIAATIAERARIAREMHDMVSHQVSLISVEAGALQVTTADPAMKMTARQIRELSVNALTELRYLLGVLRAAPTESLSVVGARTRHARIGDHGRVVTDRDDGLSETGQSSDLLQQTDSGGPDRTPDDEGARWEVPGTGVAATPRASTRKRSHQRMALRIVVVVGVLIELYFVFSDAPTMTAVLAAIGVATLLFAWRWPVIPLVVNLGVACVGATIPIALPIVNFMIANSSRQRWMVASSTTAMFIVIARPWSSVSDGTWVIFVPLSLFIAATSVILGLLVRTRRDLESGLIDLNESHRREAMMSVRLAVGAERARVSQEMKMLVTQHITAIATHAEKIETTSAAAPERESARVIRDLSAKSLLELRYLLTALQPERDIATGAETLPTIERLEALIRESGLDVHTFTRIDGDLPAAVQLSLYRIVQEGLTNVRKHASGAGVQLSLMTTDELIVLTLENEPSIAGADPSFPSSGHGLIGVKERVELLGGQLQSGPTSIGGFRMTVRVPR